MLRRARGVGITPVSHVRTPRGSEARLGYCLLPVVLTPRNRRRFSAELLDVAVVSPRRVDRLGTACYNLVGA